MTTRTISLDVRNTASNGADGYTNAIASDGTVYSYQFSEQVSGHKHVGGNVTFNARGAAKVKVKLQPGGQYQIDYVDFAHDVDQQLSWTARGQPYQAEIDNKNDTLASVYYTVTVIDTNKNYCTITCDPMINNR